MTQLADTPPPVPAAVAVGALLAPVVACLRNDDNGVRVLLEGTCADGTVAAAVAAAPAVVRVYLRLAPPPDGADRILTGFVAGALDRFRDRSDRRRRVRRRRARARAVVCPRRRGVVVLVVRRT